MKKQLRLLACGLPATGCGLVLLLLALELVWTHLPSRFGSLKGQQLYLICWQEGRDDGGWFSLALPQRRFTRITDTQGLEDFFQRWPHLGAFQGDLLVTLAFQDGGDKTSIRCRRRSAGERWLLSRNLSLPFRDQGLDNSGSKLPPLKQETYAVALACSPKGTYAVLAWRQGEQVNLYRLDLNRGSLKRFAQLPSIGNDYYDFHLACAENGQVYVQDSRGKETNLTCYDAQNRCRVLPWHQEVFSCLTGNYGMDASAHGADITITLSDLDHPERAPEHYHCKAIETLNRLEPDLLRRTGGCDADGIFASSNGQWIGAQISIEDKVPAIIGKHSFRYYILWRRHQSDAAYGYDPENGHSGARPIGIAIN